MNTVGGGLDNLTKFEFKFEYNSTNVFHFIPVSTKNAKSPQKSLKKLEACILAKY